MHLRSQKPSWVNNSINPSRKVHKIFKMLLFINLCYLMDPTEIVSLQNWWVASKIECKSSGLRSWLFTFQNVMKLIILGHWVSNLRQLKTIENWFSYPFMSFSACCSSIHCWHVRTSLINQPIGRSKAVHQQFWGSAFNVGFSDELRCLPNILGKCSYFPTPYK